MTTRRENSEFLLNLILEENQHLNPIDFIDKTDKSNNFACVCVSLAIFEKYQEIKDTFTNLDEFSSIYFQIYASALENYRSIVGNNLRQIYFDEAKIFYPTELTTNNISKLVTDENNKAIAIHFLDSIKGSYAIILRDEIAYVIIHQDGDNYIVIDPHVEYCGILSKSGVYRYTTYDGIWDFNVSLLTKNISLENKQ